MTKPESTAPHVRKTAARVRSAIGSAKGAQRNADNRYSKSERVA